MQVKVFEAEDMAAALKKVRETLGPDALILSTRTVRGKGLGLLGKPMTEVTAAIDGAGPIASAADKTPSVSSPARPPRSARALDDDIRYEDIWHSDSTIDPPATKGRGRRERQEAAHLSSIRTEIDTIKELVQGFAREISDMSKAIATIQDTGQHTNMLTIGDDWLAPVAGVLANRGIQAEATAAILKIAAAKLTPGQVNSRELLDNFFAETITGLVQVDSPILRENPGQQRVALVGPTGVGKTTTIAKLAAAYLKKFGRRLALVTIDTYRIAAVEQLKVYGEIMNLEVEVVMSPSQLKEVLSRHEDKKMLLIDTAGRSPKDNRSIEELADFLQPDLKIDSHLVLAATARERELHEAVKRFGMLDLKSFIFTKLDECESFGALLNVHTRNNCPLSYLTDGQKVPEDLMIAEPQKIAGLIMGKPYQIRSRNAATA
jgi:flagellar biosynthesis protein FlhF